MWLLLFSVCVCNVCVCGMCALCVFCLCCVVALDVIVFGWVAARVVVVVCGLDWLLLLFVDGGVGLFVVLVVGCWCVLVALVLFFICSQWDVSFLSAWLV